MDNKTRVALAATVLFLTACTTTQQVADVAFSPPQGDYRVIVMQPDINVGVLTAGGAVEPHEQWTNQARENVPRRWSQQPAAAGRRRSRQRAKRRGGDPAAVADSTGSTRRSARPSRLHKYCTLLVLPTKKILRLDARRTGRRVRRVHRVRLRAVPPRAGFVLLRRPRGLAGGGSLTCLVGVCIAGGRPPDRLCLARRPEDGPRRVVQRARFDVGDIRSPEGADKMVTTLLGT